MTGSSQKLADIQNCPPTVPLPINSVGVRGLRRALRLKDRANGSQTVAAAADLGVNLPACRRGTHMSRMVEILEQWDETLGCQSARRLLDTLARRLGASTAWAAFQFDYLLRKTSPARRISATQAYACSIYARMDESGMFFITGVRVPVMTVCPCSLAISATGAHSQRAIASVQARMNRFAWLEEFIEIAEASGSSPVYPLLKREDEKHVTETAFANPAFVEDVARGIARGLNDHPNVDAYCVEVESMESIHNHNAFARIRTDDWRFPPA